MEVYLIGGRGRLGQAIATEYAGTEFVTLDRETYGDWSHDEAADQVNRYFKQHASETSVVFVASGLLDPSLPPQELMRINYTLPKNVIDGVRGMGIKVITFGTVMERLAKKSNHYVYSKIRLSEYIKTISTQDQEVTHIQLHTLYGAGRPSPFMFLGQMLAALHADQPFKMSSGLQLREYHHFTDAAVAIRRITASAGSGVIHLSHGDPLSLRKIAESVFDALGKSHLLRVGALPSPPGENFDQLLEVDEIIQEVHFRDSLPAIIEYMRNCHISNEES